MDIAPDLNDDECIMNRAFHISRTARQTGRDNRSREPSRRVTFDSMTESQKAIIASGDGPASPLPVPATLSDLEAYFLELGRPDNARNP